LGLIIPNLVYAETFLVATIGSHHFDRDKGYCELNPGIGFEHGSRTTRLVAGVYQNSLCLPSQYVGVSWSPLVSGAWSAGVALIAVTGYEKNKRGTEALLAPLPTISYEGRNFGVNFIVIPPYDDFSGAIGLQLKVRF
jgi:hypothetical protein